MPDDSVRAQTESCNADEIQNLSLRSFVKAGTFVEALREATLQQCSSGEAVHEKRIQCYPRNLRSRK